MSHSAFRILTNDEPINRNLVIVVNKNGQVSTDTEALQDLLTSKEVPRTGISILRESSPTSSIADEIEQERQEKFEMKRQEFLSAHEGEEIDEEELENQMKLITGTMDDDIPHVTLTVENFYPPDQAKKFATDVLQLGGIDNPQSLMPIDFNFRRQTIQNDHCYTPLTQSPERSGKPPGKASSSKVSQNKSLKREHKPTPKARQQTEEDSSDSGEAALDDDEEYEEEQSDEQDEISFSESDDDNDIDFSVNDRFGKKGRKKRKYRKLKDRQKNPTFKDFLETGDVPQMEEEPKKKYVKVPKKVAVQQQKPSTSGKIVNAISKNTQPLPVVVKKITQPQTTIPKNIIIRKEPLGQFIPLTANFKNHLSQLPTQISIQSSQPMKSKQEIEFVDSLVKDLEKSFPESDKRVSTSIPNIMQMMETNTSAEIIDQSLSRLEHLDSGDGAEGIEEIGAIIAVLGNEAIDELLNSDLTHFDPTHTSPALTPSLHALTEAPTSTPVANNQMPKILNKQAPVKDPVKVVRHGRVITLPVITAPTTRGAKRRAQGDSPNSSITSPNQGKVAKTEKTPSNKDPDSTNSSRRSSLNKSESGKSSRRQSFVQSLAAPEELDDLNSDGSWVSEDDPDRLWCICKQPHNNRFMICCDKCEDWFHGTCVNVTKSMGKDIEMSNKKWLCPNCKTEGSAGFKKIDTNKKPLNQQKLTKFFAKNQKASTDEDVVKTTCVVCKHKPARDSSIYCSDECIQNHATKHLDEGAQPKEQPGKRGNVFKDKNGNVMVYEKKTMKVLPLSQSPHISQLGQWLIKNPNYEPIKPGSAEAEQMLGRNKTQSQQPTPTSPLKLPQSSTSEDLFSNPVKISTGVTPSAPTVVKKNPAGQHSGNSGSVRTISVKNTSSSAGVKSSHAISKPNVSSTTNKSPAAKPEHKKLKSQSSEDKPPPNLSSKMRVEHDRLMIRNTLKDTLNQRMREFDHPDIPKMTEEEIAEFAKETEKEMFLFFNKDIREKYKAKYRSLKFNLSDVKNKTLMERICAKKLTPKQLVELPSAALASEELSSWREYENKHQLEIITKSELESLAQTKIVVKTHKGEEIIEQKSTPSDILVPIDDIESIIDKTVLSVEDPHSRYDLSKSISLNISGGHSGSPLSSPSITSSTGRKSDSKHKSRSRSKSRGKDHHHHHKSSSSKHKKSERHRSKSPRHHSSRDKDRKSRDKSRDRSKSKKSDDHKSSSHRDKSREKDKSSSSRTKDNKPKDSKNHQKAEEKPDVKAMDIVPDQQDVDIVGKILGSMGVHLDAPKKEEKVKEEPVKPKVEVPAVPVKVTPRVSSALIAESKMVEIYSGRINMNDVGKPCVTASIVSGNFEDIPKSFPSQLDVVGRIETASVMSYLDKVRKLPGRELLVMRFTPTEESKDDYERLFKYLHERQRFGVIKDESNLISPSVKDFYVIPLEANEPTPKVLLPFKGPGFIEGDAKKPALLLGVLLKIDIVEKIKKPVKRPQSKPSRSQFSAEIPSTHKSHSKLTMGLPEFSKTGELVNAASSLDNDGDEPYTPFDDDELVSPPNFSSTTPTKNDNIPYETEMQRVERQIEERQMEIQTLAQQSAMDMDMEQASRIFENINVPHNLSEILSNISKNDAKPMEIDNDDDDEYVPTLMVGAGPASSVEYHGKPIYSAMSQPITNSMMDIDERIALFQDPMDMEVLPSNDQPSRLASMSAADLMKLVPDDAFEAPPAPNISGDRKQNTIPGLDTDEYEIE